MLPPHLPCRALQNVRGDKQRRAPVHRCGGRLRGGVPAGRRPQHLPGLPPLSVHLHTHQVRTPPPPPSSVFTVDMMRLGNWTLMEAEDRVPLTNLTLCNPWEFAACNFHNVSGHREAFKVEPSFHSKRDCSFSTSWPSHALFQPRATMIHSYGLAAVHVGVQAAVQPDKVQLPRALGQAGGGQPRPAPLHPLQDHHGAREGAPQVHAHQAVRDHDHRLHPLRLWRFPSSSPYS